MTSAMNEFLEAAGKSSGQALTVLLGEVLAHNEIFVFGEARGRRPAVAHSAHAC